MTVEENTLKNNKYFCKRCKDRNWLVECSCGTCGQILFRRDKWNSIHYYKKAHHLIGKPKEPSMKGENHYNWKGGRKLHRGYAYLHMPEYYRSEKSGYVPEHVYFYEQYHKLCMLPWGHVHHIEPVRKDYCNNMIWNLQGMMSKHHIGNHKIGNKNNLKDMTNRFCLLCESKTTLMNKKKGYYYWYEYKDGYLCNVCYNRNRKSSGLV